MSLCKVSIFPYNYEVQCEAGDTLLSVINRAGAPLPTPCGGKGICGKCRVAAQGALSPPAEEELSFCSNAEEHLACKTKVLGEARVTLQPQQNPCYYKLPVFSTNDAFAFAVDLGTTVIEVFAVNLTSGKAYKAASFMNPQRIFGYDVISRIQAADKNAASLTSSLRSAVAAAVNDAAARAGVSGVGPERIVIAGNTAMCCFFAGEDVSSLGAFPYSMPTENFDILPAKSLGFDMPTDTPVYILPAAAGFIGGDITGALALYDAAGLRDGFFFIDMGTNGEMFLRTGETISAISCAMGPALEGMNINCGMTASEDAALRAIDAGDELVLETSGGEKAKGICGTALIDALAIMVERGLLDPSGKFIQEKETQFANAYFTDSGFLIDETVLITQKDVRNVQLAKAACLAGARLLFEKSGAAPEDIKLAAIAGSLGSGLNIKHFNTLGFLPLFANAKTILTGNTCIAAAIRCCAEPDFFAQVQKLRRRINVIEPAADSRFNELFLQAFDFVPAI